MTTSDWITLGAAILVGGGTLFLGIMAWRTIRQTTSIQKAEKREGLLNEIIDWVIQINKSCIPPSGIGREAYKEWSRNIVSSLSSEGKWALRSSNIFGSEFNKNINNLLGKISNFNDCITGIRESSDISTKQAKEMLSKHVANTLKATDDVLDIALKIRTKDVS